MSQDSQPCPKCGSPYGYMDGSHWTCPECFHEWVPQEDLADSSQAADDVPKYLDANGVQLQNGDTVSTVKDLKVGSSTIKSGTKVKNIKLLDQPVDGHDISCKIQGHGSVYLKCSVVKKVK